MKLDDILQLLDEERRYGSRFPVRIIFVEQLLQYRAMVQNLTQVCDEVLQLSNFCNANDIFPNFRKLRKSIDALQGKRILILSMGEYLRLGIKRELQSERAQFPSFWQSQQDAASKTRVIVPLFACKEIFERIVQSVDERQQDHLWTMEPESDIHEVFHLKVYSPKFAKVIKGTDIVYGFEKWLQAWDSHICNKNCAIITSLYNNVENISGTLSVRVIDNPFGYVTNVVTDGNKLKRDWGTEEQWASVIPIIENNNNFSKAITKKLNVRTFEAVSVLAQWSIMKFEQKWMVWLWYRLNDSDDYYGYAIRKAESYKDIEYEICNSILDVVSQRPEWIEQRMQAMAALKVKVNGEFWEKLDALALPETKLKLLTCQTHEERTFAIRIVNRWLRRGAAIDAVIEHITEKFALFKAYLKADCPDLPMELNDYFNWYKIQKIKNEYPSTAENEVNKVCLDVFDSRFSKLKLYAADKDVFFLWIDGMGIEWLPLLLTCLKKYQPNVIITTDIARAIIPTETCFNEQWKDYSLPYEKINKLDNLAHKGMPDDKDYFSCIDYQISVIDEIAMKAINVLESHDYVIITADHGSSRMAALSFHTTPGIAAPKRAIVRSYGRYCELNSPPVLTDMLPCTRLVKNEDNKYIVMATHEHYAQSGNAAGGNDDNNAVVGEVHGGMTPEEILVPVIAIKRNTPLMPLDYVINSSTVYRDKGKVKITLEFNRPIVSLDVVIDSINGKCTCEHNNLWSVTFENMGLQSYSIDVYANGRLLKRHEKFTVKAKGISKNEDPFGGF